MPCLLWCHDGLSGSSVCNSLNDGCALICTHMQVAQRVDVLLCDLASALLPAAEGQVDVLVSLFVAALLLGTPFLESFACRHAGQ